MIHLGVSYCVHDKTQIPDLIFNIEGCERILAKKFSPVIWQYDAIFSALFVYSCRS